MSQWRRRYSVRHSRSACFLGSMPRPATERRTFSYTRPQPARADERLVVEARRRERAADHVGGAHDVEVEPRLRVRVLDRQPVGGGLRAGAHARPPADLDQRVGALPAAADLAARAVVLERAAEGAPAGGEQRGGDRVAREPRDRLAVEGEGERRAAVDPLAGLRGEPAHATPPGVAGRRGHALVAARGGRGRRVRRERRPLARRSSACRARPGTRPGSPSGGTTIRAASRRRSGGSSCRR